MTPLGTHAGCGGAVILLENGENGYRLCTDCNRRGVDVALVEEQPKTPTTVKATIGRRLRAFAYVKTLKIGYLIEPKEEQAIDEFAIYLQAALIHYGKDIEKVVGGWKVVRRLVVA